MLTDFTNDESKKRAAIDLLKNADEGERRSIKKNTHLVCQLLKIPMSFVSILEDEKQYIKCAQNIAITETSLGRAFCEQTLNQGKTFICHDTHQPPIFHRDRDVRRSAIHSLLCGVPADNPRWGERGYLEYFRYSTQGTFR